LNNLKTEYINIKMKTNKNRDLILKCVIDAAISGAGLIILFPILLIK